MNQQKTPIKAVSGGFPPFLLTSLCMLLTLLSLCIHKFVFPLGKDPLSPALLQLLILLLPALLALFLLTDSQDLSGKMRDLGFGRLRADYIFFLIYGAMFAITTGILLQLLFGAKQTAEGFALLGIFKAGANEYSVSAPYLILVYALVPAVIEEIAFRGVLFGSLRPLGHTFSVVMTTLLSSLFVFSPGGLAASLFCNLTYSFIRHTTGALQACIPVHFAVNLFSLYLGTNICRYFLSSQSNALLLLILIALWLVSTALFCGESARLYKKKADAIKEGTEKSTLPTVSLKALLRQTQAVFSHVPTLICACFTLAAYVAVVLINYLV